MQLQKTSTHDEDKDSKQNSSKFNLSKCIYCLIHAAEQLPSNKT